MHDQSALFNRLRKVMRQRRPWATRQRFEAFRLYDHDIPELRYIVDIYGKHAVVYDRTRAIAEDLSDADDMAPDSDKDGSDNSDDDTQAASAPTEELIAGIASALQFEPARIHLKKRRRMPGAQQYTKLGSDGASFGVREGDLLFLVNLTDYLDTGLFLDHRPLRQQFARTPVQRFLNLFCYTASLSAAAASAGAITTSVDLSHTYLDWAKENFKLNALQPEQHRFEQGDARAFLAAGPGRDPLYDLIFFDPPTFSNSKRMRGSFDVQRDHGQLLDQALSFLKPGGALYFSTNRRRFQLDERFSRRPNLSIEDCSESTIPEDFRDRKIHRCFRLQRS